MSSDCSITLKWSKAPEERDSLNAPFDKVSMGKDGHATIMATRNEFGLRHGKRRHRRAETGVKSFYAQERAGLITCCWKTKGMQVGDYVTAQEITCGIRNVNGAYTPPTRSSAESQQLNMSPILSICRPHARDMAVPTSRSNDC